MNAASRRKCFALLLAGVVPFAVLGGCSAIESESAPLAVQPAAGTLAANFSNAGQEATSGDPQRAIANLRGILLADPSNHEAQIKLGDIYLRLNKPSEAIKQFTPALSSSELAPVAKQGLGLSFLRLGDTQSARKYLSEAVGADVGLWRAHLGLGQLADQARDWAAAEAAYRAALAAGPHPSVHNNLGLSYARQRRYDEAIVEFQKSLALKLDPVVRTNLRFAYAMKGDYLNALAGVAKENLADALNNVGYAAMVRGDYDAAEAYLTRAIETSVTHHRPASDNLQLLKELRQAKLARAAP